MLGRRFFFRTLLTSMLLWLTLFRARSIANEGPREAGGGSPQPEISALLSATDPGEQQKLIKALVSRIGPESAQDELVRSGLPFTGESHLVIHTVGALLYERLGTQGITHCRPYFLGACYHGFLIEAVSEHGPDVIPAIWFHCQEGGPATMNQCAHAAGHGLLAWSKRSIKAVLSTCDSISAHMDHFTPFNCYDGVFMENIWGLHHEHMGQHLEAAMNLDDTCDDRSFEQRYVPACWGNQVSVLYKKFKGDLSKISRECESLPNDANKDACFNGLARQINPLTRGSADEAFRLCAEASSGQRYDNCLITNSEAAFSVGDEAKMPFEICSRIEEGFRAICYQRLSSLIAVYTGKNTERAERLCAIITEPRYRDSCRMYDRDFVAHATEPMPDITNDIATRRLVGAGVFYRAFSASSKEPQAPDYPYPYPYVYPYPYPYPAVYQCPYQVPYLTPRN